jgi:hypothetical protein
MLKEPRQRQELRLDVVVECVELRLKLIANFNDPTHNDNMA